MEDCMFQKNTPLFSTSPQQIVFLELSRLGGLCWLSISKVFVHCILFFGLLLIHMFVSVARRWYLLFSLVM